MKKVFMLFLGLFLMFQISVAQNINKFIDEFAKTEGIERIKIGGILFQASKLFIPAEAKNSVVKKLTSVEVLATGNITPESMAKFAKKFANFKDGNGFETLIKVKDGGDNVTVFAERKGDIIKSLTIFVIDEEDIVVVRIKGKIKDADIAKLVDEYAKNL
jgi:hypothetical protein